jgi:hypothetical protein
MSVASKILILVLLNLAAMFYLVYKIISLGHTFINSLRLAWDLILGEAKDLDHNIYLKIIWVPVLRKTWWLMLTAYAIAWFITEDLLMTIGLILLIGVHVLWYLYASLTLKTKYDRILYLNSHWGIIYKEISAGSFLIQKSLAELDLRKKNLLVLTIERNNQLTPFPKGLEIIQAGDRIVIFGDLSACRSVSW